uniref:Uncharacterized protein n=1 Tax=Fusarium oxysporum (strain Fo5176) TaxID=660025 RepID=A0A0D2XG56_FUSOF
MIDTRDFPEQTFLRDLDALEWLHEDLDPEFKRLYNYRNGRFYFGEYLTQGYLDITGKCVEMTMQQLVDGGLFTVICPALDKPQNDWTEWPKAVCNRLRVDIASNKAVGQKQIRTAIFLARDCVGDRFLVPLALMLLGLRSRQSDNAAIANAFHSLFTEIFILLPSLTGYDLANLYKYSRNNQPFIIPSFRKGKVLILPPAQLKAIYNKRENELKAHDPASEALSFEWTIRNREVYPSNYTVDVIRKWITKRFDELAAELQEELCLAVDEQFGMSQEWREVKLWPAVQRIFTRGLNRVLVGFPLCELSFTLERPATDVKKLRQRRSLPRDYAAVCYRHAIPRFIHHIGSESPQANLCSVDIMEC